MDTELKVQVTINVLYILSSRPLLNESLLRHFRQLVQQELTCLRLGE